MKEVILIGNPNTGKTTLFNSLTKSDQHTGNWHGVTVDSKFKTYKYNNQAYKVVDLPGIYSLSAFSFEEMVSINYIYSNTNKLIINILDINNLNKNLYLTQDLLLLGIPMIMVINKTSKPEKFIYKINELNLQKQLNVKVLKLDVKDKNDIKLLKEEINKYYENKREINYTFKINSLNQEQLSVTLQNTTNLIKKNVSNNYLNINYLSLKCLENDDLIINNLKLTKEQTETLKQLQKNIDIENIIKLKQENITKILNRAGVKRLDKVYGKNKLDKFVLNKFLALPIFFLILLAIFYLTFFSVGAYISNVISNLLQNVFGCFFLNAIKSITSSQIVYSFFETAIVGGLSAIVSFLPQVVILFLCLGILEDSGYLSRVAFSLDDIFAKVGLSGKSVYTLLMGFGCATTACLTSRTMEDKNSKIKTALLTPYISCSAKLPIYSVIGCAFFKENSIFVIFSMYIFGIVVALLLSVFFDKTFLKSKEKVFIMEFPSYRAPSLKRIANLVIENIKQFGVRVVSLLISVNIIVWVLSNFSFTFQFVQINGGESMLEVLGKVFAPIFSPLGLGNWGMISALIVGLVAKELIVSTIAMLNGVSYGKNITDNQLQNSLLLTTSCVFFSPASALAFITFSSLYSPCFATMSVLKKEVGKKWTFIAIVSQFVIAYIITFIVFNLANLITLKGFLPLIFFIITLSSITYTTCLFLKNRKKLCKNCSRCKR